MRVVGVLSGSLFRFFVTSIISDSTKNGSPKKLNKFSSVNLFIHLQSIRMPRTNSFNIPIAQLDKYFLGYFIKHGRKSYIYILLPQLHQKLHSASYKIH